jgi:hypothetical protein
MKVLCWACGETRDEDQTVACPQCGATERPVVAATPPANVPDGIGESNKKGKATPKGAHHG